jgi:hypothetical protein
MAAVVCSNCDTPYVGKQCPRCHPMLLDFDYLEQKKGVLRVIYISRKDGE